MASNQPNQELVVELSNRQIEVQASKWDAEAQLYRFECAIDTLDKISDGLPDDPVTTNALNGLHECLSNIHAEFKAELLTS